MLSITRSLNSFELATDAEEYLLSAYLAGLRLDTQMHVRMFHPTSTRECLVLGRLYEKAHPRREGKGTWNQAKPGYNQQKGLLSVWKEESGNQKEELGKPKEMNGKLKPFLTQAEMSERRAKGLCYYCDEKFTPDHYLKHKKTQLYAMECEEEEIFHEALGYESEEEKCYAEEQARISINAISGITDYTTMKVRGTHGKKPIYVLIDSGSTHNFMDIKTAKKLGCHIKEAGKTRVAVADGNRIEVTGKIENFHWSFKVNYLFLTSWS